MLVDIRDAVHHVEQRMQHLEQRMDARFAAVDRRFDTLDRHVVWIVGIQVTTLVAVIGALVAGG